MAKGFFITATDTEVGKTIIAAALVRVLKSQGLSVCAMKPVESGCRREGDILISSDGNFLREASDVEEPIENITPVRFEEPIAPWVAAERQGKEIDLNVIGEKFRGLSERYDAIVVEGIGGLMVPIRRDYFVLDLAVDLRLPVIIVASAYLGTINHTLLTVERAMSKGVDIAGIVINHHRKPDGTVAEETNASVLERLLKVPVIGAMPYLNEVSMAGIESAARENLDIEMLRKYF